MHHAIPLASGDPRHAAMATAVSSCVHCGFCLPACPTYRVLGEEMDSPRGRIVLMKEVLEGALPLDDAAPHLDRCLGCLACETACPSGVRYRDLIEPMRERLQKRRPAAATAGGALLVRILASPGAFRLAAALGGGMKAARALLPEALGAMLDLVPARLPAPTSFPRVVPAVGTRRGRVALMTGCVQHVLRPSITESAIAVLTTNGVDVVIPPDQGCCGALALHAGHHHLGAAMATAHAARFPTDVDALVTTAAGCGSSMAATHTSGATVVDATEYLDRLGMVTHLRLPAPARVAYQDACHLAHAQQVTAAPRRLLAAIEGLTLVPLADAGLCCGSAGLYNIEQPAIAAELGHRKAATVIASGASLVVTANIGCLTQMRSALDTAGHAVDVQHVLELLAMASRSARGPE